MLQVVVGLFAQGVLGGQRQLGEPLGGTACEGGPGEQPGRQDREDGQGALTGQMFSLGVPKSCTMRSIWWISEVPGSSGLCASSSARMQPAALQSTGASSVTPRSLQPPSPTQAASAPPLPHVYAGGLGRHPQQQLRRAVPAQGTLSGRAGTSPSRWEDPPRHQPLTTESPPWGSWAWGASRRCVPGRNQLQQRVTVRREPSSELWAWLEPEAGAGTHLSSHSLYQSSAGWKPSGPCGKWSSWR